MTDETTTPEPQDDAPAEVSAEVPAEVSAEVLPDPAPLPVPGAGEVDYEPLAGGTVADVNPSDLDMVLDVPVELSVEIGRTIMTIRETLEIGPGAIITL